MSAAPTSQLDRVCWGSWRTRWGPSEELKQHYPPRHSDYRDSAPEPLSDVFDFYQPVVQQGLWTHGLIEMWFFKHKPVKHSVHIPCWDSFKWNPLKWRGACFGRTCVECYWTGLRQMRWARAVYAANLGPEYVMPVRDIGRHGYKSDIKALCWMYCLMSCIFGCGVGQFASLCAERRACWAAACNFLCNFGSCFSCHARERLRRRYQLPPTFCLPPGIDDCLVHFLCFYCASHQELRELAVRGVDGPGMHILDVLPDSFQKAEGIDQAKAERRVVLQSMLARPPKMFRARGPKEAGTLQERVAAAAAQLADRTLLPGEEADAEKGEGRLGLHLAPSGALSIDTEASVEELGWHRYRPPPDQEMRRVEVHRAAEPAAPSQQQQWQAAAACAHLGRSQSETRRGGGGPEGAQGAEQLRVEPRAWSIAY